MIGISIINNGNSLSVSIEYGNIDIRTKIHLDKPAKNEFNIVVFHHIDDMKPKNAHNNVKEPKYNHSINVRLKIQSHLPKRT